MNDKLTSKHMEMSSSETPLQKDVQGYNIDRGKKQHLQRYLTEKISSNSYSEYVTQWDHIIHYVASGNSEIMNAPLRRADVVSSYTRRFCALM